MLRDYLIFCLHIIKIKKIKMIYFINWTILKSMSYIIRNILQIVYRKNSVIVTATQEQITAKVLQILIISFNLLQ